MSRSNGGIIGKANDPTDLVANGIWSLAAAEKAKRGGNWPDIFSGTALRLDFNETTTLDSRITFTRATDGTFFNSTGVLSTASSGAARFDHRLEGGVWVNKGLLIEEQGANLALRSEEFDNAAWTKTNVTVTANSVTAPDGTTTADSLLETTTNGIHLIEQARTFNAVTTPHTYSCFVKANGRTRGQLQVIFLSGSFEFLNVSFNLTTVSLSGGVGGNGGTYLDSSITDVGNGWFRISISGFTGQNGSHSVRVFTINDVGSGSYAGDVTKGLYLWGAQLEAGAFPTSYIKTTSASVTRNADVASMTSTNFSDWYNATEGTVFAQASTFGAPAVTTRFWEISDGTGNERFFVSSVSIGSPAGVIRYGIIDGNTPQAEIDTSFAMVVNQIYKTAICYKVNDFAYSVDGSLTGTDTSGTLPTVNKINFGVNSAGSGSFLNGHIAKFYYWNTRRPNDTLQGLTS
jgi:hypothetical protein